MYPVLEIPRDAYTKSDWQFNAQSKVLQTDWLVLAHNEKAILNIDMSYFKSGILTCIE